MRVIFCDDMSIFRWSLCLRVEKDQRCECQWKFIIAPYNRRCKYHVLVANLCSIRPGGNIVGLKTVGAFIYLRKNEVENRSVGFQEPSMWKSVNCREWVKKEWLGQNSYRRDVVSVSQPWGWLCIRLYLRSASGISQNVKRCDQGVSGTLS